MMHPKYERVRMLDAAISAAVERLDRPIDWIEVRRGKVIVSAGGERMALSYQYSDSYNAQGDVLLGGGRWSVTPAQDEPEGGGGFWRRLFGRR
ncbi:MAG: hypothetical protein ABIO39_11655 [Caulobacteraceae bacterium]